MNKKHDIAKSLLPRRRLIDSVLHFVGLFDYRYVDQYIDNLNKEFDRKSIESENAISAERKMREAECERILKEKDSEMRAVRRESRIYIEREKKSYGIEDCQKDHDLGDYIVGKERLNFPVEKIRKFNAFLNWQGIKLNDEQIAILYCINPATNVIAGAGSGKSTVLALRVTFLNVFIGISLRNIMVATFTNASRSDFIYKLIGLYDSLNKELSYVSAKKVVRTYHSIAWEINNRVYGSGLKVIFGDRTPKINDEDDAAMIGDRDDNYENIDESIPALSDILNQTYKRMYSSNEVFKGLIGKLYIDSIFQSYAGSFEKDYPINRLSWLAGYDENLNDFCFRKWIELYPETETLVSRYFDAGEHEINIYSIRYHLTLPNLNAMVFLCPGIRTNASEYDDFDLFVEGRVSQSVKKLMRTKRLVAYNHASTNYLVVQSPEELKRLCIEEEQRVVKFEETDIPLRFFYKYSGEFISKAKNKDVSTQMWELITFVYSLGYSLSDLTEEVLSVHFSDCTRGDKEFLRACRMFQIGVEKEIQSLGLVTFDQIFHRLGNPNCELYERISPGDLTLLDHLLIDEFQDISPNVIKFFTNLKSTHIKLNPSDRRPKSIMTVGDDCQSIYGWRGGSVHYIQEFKDYFSIPTMHAELSLFRNYRSSKKILDFAALLFDPMGVQKDYSADGKNAYSQDSEIVFYDPISVGEKTTIDYDLMAEVLEREVLLINATPEKPVYVIYRAESDVSAALGTKLYSVLWRLEDESKVKVLTIHKSKGLEAHSVFLLGDMNGSDNNHVKNGFFEWAKMPTSYDELYNDEVLRLAYVAITRAENRLHWFLKADPSVSRGASSHFKSAYHDQKNIQMEEAYAEACHNPAC